MFVGVTDDDGFGREEPTSRFVFYARRVSAWSKGDVDGG